ncbi:ribose-5-phosphate isomerase RpiA, partial [Rhodothermus marinus]|uniref:ribose-5-phosphate isomerase RpiA n=1 Tax=Rhodothermus marinus TaxID=29549 RepID=UPI0006D0320D
REEGLHVVGVPTSYAAEQLARAEGIPLVTLADVEALDLAFDGADEVSPELNLIKGRGAAHTREKVVASLARRFVVLVDESKLVDRLGTRWPVPIEVLPMAAEPVLRQLRRMGAEPVLRMGKCKDGPVVTDQGFWVIDARFPGGIDDPHTLAVTLSTMPGVLDHGLFLGLATDVLVGQADGQVRHIRRP